MNALGFLMRFALFLAPSKNAVNAQATSLSNSALLSSGRLSFHCFNPGVLAINHPILVNIPPIVLCASLGKAFITVPIPVTDTGAYTLAAVFTTPCPISNKFSHTPPCLVFSVPVTVAIHLSNSQAPPCIVSLIPLAHIMPVPSIPLAIGSTTGIFISSAFFCNPCNHLNTGCIIFPSYLLASALSASVCGFFIHCNSGNLL